MEEKDNQNKIIDINLKDEIINTPNLIKDFPNSENENFVEETVSKLISNKNNIFYSITGICFTYLFYQKYIAPKAEKIAEYLFNFEVRDSDELVDMKNPLKKYDNFYSKMVQKILNFHRTSLDKFTSINELYKNLMNCNKESATPMWIIFKFKVFTYLFSAIYSVRFSIIINQLQILLFEKITVFNKHYLKINLNIQEEILKEQEEILMKYSENLFKKIENIIKPICDGIIINSSYSIPSFNDLIKNFRIKIEEIIDNKCSKDFYLKLFSDYKNPILEKINIYENKEFYRSYTMMNILDNKAYQKELDHYRNNVESYIKFYTILFDIINSNIFTVLLINSLEYDYSIIYETIKLNFDEIINKSGNIILNNGVPIAKIISFMMNIYENILDEKKSIYFIKEFNGKNLNEELNEIYRFICG